LAGKACYKQRMNHIMFSALAAILCVWSTVLFATDVCKDCDPVTGLTVRETVIKQRTEETRRRLVDTDVRPWQGVQGRANFGRSPVEPKVDK
jgi:hypothetical protein